MSPIDEIERAQAATLVDEDGGAVVLELAPGLSREEILGLEAEAGVALPRELRTLLEHTSGIDGSALETIDFTGRGLSVGAEELFPAGLPIAHDGYGNHWLLDLTPAEREAVPVFFLCHDPPVVLYAASSQSGARTRARSRVPSPWPPTTTCARSPRSWTSGGRSSTLREPEIGMGFEWGVFGPRTELRRHGNARIFAYARPEKRSGLLSRLFGSPARNR